MKLILHILGLFFFSLIFQFGVLGITVIKSWHDAYWVIVALLGLLGIVFIFKITNRYIKVRDWSKRVKIMINAFYIVVALLWPFALFMILLITDQIKFGFN